MKSITSPANPVYQSLKALNTSRGRREQELFLAEGPHLAEEALKAGAPLRYVALREGEESRFGALLSEAVKAGAEPLLLSARLFNSLADAETPQGILIAAGFARHTVEELDSKQDTMAIVLDRVQDPGNVGTMLRTALAVDAGFAVLAGECADPWSPKAVRASQGAVFHLKMAMAETGADAVRLLNGRGWHTACGHLEGADFFAREPHARTALVIGNEAAGVSPEAAAACSARYRLPMPGRAESLNAAVAAGIMLYDLWREQHK